MPELSRRALVTGVTGQDGSYLCELLLAEGYEVHGMVMPGELIPTTVPAAVHLHEGLLTDSGSLQAALDAARPDEVYNLAAATSVAASFDDPVAVADVTGLGVLRLLQAIRGTGAPIRLLQASSAEIFGGAEKSPQDETTPLCPISPYGVAKAFAHQTVQLHRRTHAVFAATAILYNHESPRRGPGFVTRKITTAAARISRGLDGELRLGNLDVERDWGYAPDYVRAMHLALQQETADDYVVATGETHPLRELLDIAFTSVGLDWHRHVVADPALLRPAEPVRLCGDASRARARLGWAPTRDFPAIIREMVMADLDRLDEGGHPPGAGPAGPSPDSPPRPAGMRRSVP
ncbi:MAG: GDP-mannose 4,6-dehydratase [Candidatus Dormibacteria bacterium]|jgi:GDPmannose 4,6-dehydratase